MYIFAGSPERRNDRIDPIGMTTEKHMLRTLGNEPPILADGRRAPDRREISLR
jgi:hypothetical protein